MVKYHLLYQEQVTLADGYSLCSWTQFRKRAFAKHINTQCPPKFFKALQRLLTDDATGFDLPVSGFDQDTGQMVSHPTDYLYSQLKCTFRPQDTKDPEHRTLKPYYRLASNPHFFPQLPQIVLTPIPSKGYC